IGAALWLGTSRAASARTAAEEAAEQIAEVAEVVDREVAAAEVARVEARPGATAVLAEAVVLLALLLVGERVVRVLDLLELLFRGGVARVLVRVVLRRQLAVRLLDLIGRGVLLDAQRVVQSRHLVLRRSRRRDDDARRPQDLVTQLVALLAGLDHGALFRLGRLREQRLVHVRIELPVGLDLGETLLPEQVGERAVHEANTLLELRLFVLRRSLECTAEVVEDRNQLLDDTLVRT